jgi:hypothetical protein
MLEGCLFDVAAIGQRGFVAAAVNAIAPSPIDPVQDRVEDEIRHQIPLPFPVLRLSF